MFAFVFVVCVHVRVCLFAVCVAVLCVFMFACLSHVFVVCVLVCGVNTSKYEDVLVTSSELLFL